MRRQDTEGAALKIVEPVETARGGERKRRRLAATIARPEPNRPRLPAQGDTAAMFDTESWRRRWAAIRPMAETTNVYVAGCPGTMALGGILGVPIFKPGTAQDVGARMRKLNAQRYGSVVISDFAVHDEQGWSAWEAAKLSAPSTHPASPVRVLPRSLAVELPFWITPQDFEALIQAALDPITLASVAASPLGRALCRQRGCDPHTLLRYSRGPRGPKMATEICAMAPSGDAGRLVALAEWIVIHLVVADDGWEG